MDFTGFIAGRYLFSRKHISLISTLTFISIAGVTMGTALLIVVLSVFNGFFDVVKQLLLTSDPDIKITSVTSQPFLFSDSLRQKLENVPEIVAISPFVEGKGILVIKGSRNEVTQVKGIDQDLFFQLQTLSKTMNSGVFDLGVHKTKPGILLNEYTMSRYGLSETDDVALLSPAGMRKALTQITVPRIYTFEIRGSYAQQQVVDGSTTYVDIEAAQRLFDTRDSVHGLDIKLTNNNLAEALQPELEKLLGPGYQVRTWYQLQKPLYDVMRLEKRIAYLVLLLIVMVAVLNILGSLTMIVIQKKRDIGILLAMGAAPSAINRIFTRQGFLIGLIGCTMGSIIGLALTWLQIEFGIIKLSSAFVIDAYPASIQALDVSVILAGSMLLCLSASWYPARRAMQVSPADAVRV